MTGRVDLHVRLDTRADLCGQVYRQVRAAIADGLLRSGDALPSSRELATRLALSRNTVATAYDRLAAEGFLTARGGVGTFVSDVLATAPARDRDHSPLRPRAVWDELYDPPDMAAERVGLDLRTGVPDATTFPYATWRALLADQLRPTTVGGAAHIDPAGHPGLRAAIARHIGVSRGVRAGAADVLVTNGSQQAVDLLARVLLAPGDVAAVEDPGYPPPSASLRSLGVRVVGVPVDAEGLVVLALPATARLVYMTPSHQFPLGVTMSLRRRLALLAWAREHDAAIVEDDYDGEFRYGGRPLEPLHTLDDTGRVVYVGSFSKVLLPTLRLGFLVAPTPLHAALRKAKHVADWHTPVPLQAAAACFLDRGHLVGHLRRMRRRYAERHRIVIDALAGPLAEHLDGIPSACGLHVTALLRRPGDDAAVARRAAELGVAIAPLSQYALTRRSPSGLPIGYGAIATDRLPEALHRLGRACAG